MEATQEVDTDTPTIAKITRAYMCSVGVDSGIGKQISLRRFARLLGRPVTDEGFTGVSHQSIHNWVRRAHAPDRRFLELLRKYSEKDTWQYGFAFDTMKLMNTLIIQKSNYSFELTDEGIFMFRSSSGPNVDFFPGAEKWDDLDKHKTHQGNATSFLHWYREQLILLV